MQSMIGAFLVNALLLCNGFVLMSSVPAGAYGDMRLFQSPLSYSVDSTVLLNDVTSHDKDVGYKIKAKLTVDPVWSDSAAHFLLKFQLKSPRLHVRSKAAPHEGFIEHTSPLDNYKNAPFFAEWKNGIVEKIFINNNEEPSFISYKKGLVSVFQFQILDVNSKETDVSGTCDTSYHTLSPTTIRKIKTNCINENNPDLKRTSNVLSAVANSARITRYDFTEDLTTIKQIYAEELHDMKVSIKQDAGNKLRVWQELNLLEDNLVTDALKAKNVEEALQEIEAKYGFILKAQDLKIKIQDDVKNAGQNLAKLIKDNRELLRADSLGTEKSALVFIRVLEAMRSAKSDDIVKALKGVKNKDILQQLCDAMGFTQTYAAHQAAKSFLNFDNEYDKENIERYLWALSIGPRPDEKVILDILKMSEDPKMTEHIQETLLLTASAMTNKYVEGRGENAEKSISNKVKDSIAKNLSKCKESTCQIKYLRALKNLRRPDTIEILLDHIEKGPRNVAVMALKALRAMPREFWSEKVLKTCKKVFYQLAKRYDSSARTLAVDIILDSRPGYHDMVDFVAFLARNDTDFEVKQFLLQRIQMISEKCSQFKRHIGLVIQSMDKVNNWDTLAAKGLSTALSRAVASTKWSNVSLVSVQEISGGILKRGHVDVMIEHGGENQEVFSLGLFAGGLTSLMGSSGDSDETAEEEPATAGMELTVQGVQIRPFTFFSGQGELMGHVWSGTASERTTAFQALLLLQEQSQLVVLGTGAVARWSLTGAVSFDLAGQIQLSLWNRVAHSVVDKNAGIAVQGVYTADTPFVKSEVSFTLTLEAQLELESDIDFYDGVSLCIQVKQPDTTVRHNITKQESIPQNKHMMRKSKFKTVKVPGKTYALNRKNSHMCNGIHNKK